MNKSINKSKPELRCKDLSKIYGEGDSAIRVLNNITLDIQAGESIAIVGASGVGKSTLLQLLGGLDAPDAGQVWLADQELTALSEKAKGKLRNQYLGFVYQFHHLLPEFTALENVMMPLLIAGQKPKVACDAATQYLERVGLADRFRHRVGELSGGERQRVAIARALVMQPHCVLADEPTGNLDQGTSEQIWELLLELNRELATSLVIVTHNLSLATTLNRALVLSDGILSDGRL